jgi:hypothetical protein
MREADRDLVSALAKRHGIGWRMAESTVSRRGGACTLFSVARSALSY